jgi:pyruvate, water dikinase
MDESYIYWLSDLSIGDAERFGEKAAYLAEIHNKKIPVPNAFVISQDYFDWVISRFRPELEEALSAVSDLQSAYSAASRVKDIFSQFSFNEAATDVLLTNYKKIPDYVEHEKMSSLTKQLVTSGRDLPFVAIRASPLKNYPFQFKPILNAYGIEQVIDGIKRMIVSAFSPQAIYYRYKQGINQLDFSMAIIVQKMAHAIRSGDMFSINPIKNDKSEIYVQAIWGINSDLLANPSSYVFNKQTRQIVEKQEIEQAKYYSKNAQFGELLLEPLPDEMRRAHLLSERELTILSDLASRIEQIMNFPQHIEWAVERNSIQILQTRPINRIFTKPLIKTDNGVLVNTFQGSGKAIIVSSKQDLQNINSSSIMITSDASREVFPYLVQSSGLITSANGLTSPASQVCRDFSIPALFQSSSLGSISSEQDVDFTGQSVDIKQPVVAEPIPQSYSDYTQSPQTPNYVSENSDIGSLRTQFEHLERSLSEYVSKEAQRRATGEHISEEDFKRSQLITELEWQIRNLRRKLETS